MVSTKLSKSEIRENYLKYARLFLQQECHYNYQESVLAARVVKYTMLVNPEFDKYNDKHPVHGERLPEHY
jgi:hypothetical protein